VAAYSTKHPTVQRRRRVGGGEGRLMSRGVLGGFVDGHENYFEVETG